MMQPKHTTSSISFKEILFRISAINDFEVKSFVNLKINSYVDTCLDGLSVMTIIDFIFGVIVKYEHKLHVGM